MIFSWVPMSKASNIGSRVYIGWGSFILDSGYQVIYSDTGSILDVNINHCVCVCVCVCIDNLEF